MVKKNHSKEYFVYFLECVDKSIYTGITTDPDRRLQEHLDCKASKYTRARQAKGIIYLEKQKDKSKALKREAEIKSWPKEKKLGLISKKYFSKADFLK